MNFFEYKNKVKERVMEMEGCDSTTADSMLDRWSDTIRDEFSEDATDDDADYTAKEIVCYDIG